VDPSETPDEQIRKIRNLIAEVQRARDHMATIDAADHVVRDCDATIVRLRAFLQTLEAIRK
jgi:hypothetical protein